MPSVSQRGTRWLDICSVITCPNSCQSVPSHWNSPGGRAFGVMALSVDEQVGCLAKGFVVVDYEKVHQRESCEENRAIVGRKISGAFN